FSLNGSYGDDRIVNGTYATIGRFKFMVYIIRKVEYDEFLCGATIISLHLALTAAHCLHTANDLTNTDLDKLTDFANKHLLVINPGESHAMLFGRRKSRSNAIEHVNTKIKDTQVSVVDVSQNLGLYMDSSLR
ncbi:hypothetical protein ILUMI_16880, partial [Ignelater luminosus]